MESYLECFKNNHFLDITNTEESADEIDGVCRQIIETFYCKECDCEFVESYVLNSTMITVTDCRNGKHEWEDCHVEERSENGMKLEESCTDCSSKRKSVYDIEK